LRYSPKPLSSRNDARDRATDFGALFRHTLLNTVATHARIIVKPVWREPWANCTWILSAVDDENREVAFELNDGTWLFAAQTLGVRESERAPAGQLWLTTLKYKYRWQADESDASWIIRWEYARTPRRANEPRAHLHVNAQPPAFQQNEKAFHRLHIPAGRVGIEDVASFLLHDQGVRASSPNADEVIEEARATFRRILGHA
jgi:hypothetical protein